MAVGGSRSTDEAADAVIVGAGLNGAATAHFLLQQGFRRVVILEAALPGSGASGAAVGLLRTHYDNRPETELAAKSMPYFRDWEAFTGEPCGWRQTGFLRFVEAHELDKMRRNVAVQRGFGEQVDILAPDEVRNIAPYFRTDDVGAAVYEPQSGTASNSLATFSLLKRACSDGASLRPFAPARRVELDNGRVVGVSGEGCRIAAPVVVLAAGASSKALAASCGVDLPLVAKAIRVAEILLPDELHAAIAYMDPISDSWLAPRQQGRALISARNPEAGRPIDPDDYAPDFLRTDAAAGLGPVQKRIPGIGSATIVRWWTRPDSYAPDGKPIIGSVAEVAGLFLNTASAGKGHKTAPAAGHALAELIAEGQTRTADLEPFNLARFRRSPQPWSDSEYGKRVIG